MVATEGELSGHFRPLRWKLFALGGDCFADTIRWDAAAAAVVVVVIFVEGCASDVAAAVPKWGTVFFVVVASAAVSVAVLEVSSDDIVLDYAATGN